MSAWDLVPFQLETMCLCFAQKLKTELQSLEISFASCSLSSSSFLVLYGCALGCNPQCCEPSNTCPDTANCRAQRALRDLRAKISAINNFSMGSGNLTDEDVSHVALQCSILQVSTNLAHRKIMLHLVGLFC